MRVVGPNCLGIVNTDPAVRLNASLAPRVPGRGRVGFFAQSVRSARPARAGAQPQHRPVQLRLGGQPRRRQRQRPAAVLGHRPGTEVVLLHLESFGNPRKFARLARRVGRTKPVVAVKSGRHVRMTEGLAGTSVAVPEESVAALFASAGVIRVETLAQLFDVGTLLAHQPLPAGDRVAVVGNSTAMGWLVSDAVLEQGMRLAHEAPTDIGAGGSAEEFRTALQGAVGDEGVDAVVAVFLPPVSRGSAEFGRALREVAAGRGQADRRHVPLHRGHPGRARRPRGGRDAGARLGAVVLHARAGGDRAGQGGAVRRLAAPPGRRGARARGGRRAGRAGRRPAALASAPGGRALTDDELITLLAAYGIPLLGTRTVTDAEAAVAAAEEVGYPVVLKSTAPWLRHRSDLGGVRLDLADADAVRAAFAPSRRATR
jgi:acyl-CoA synthetase (NDP forming)